MQNIDHVAAFVDNGLKKMNFDLLAPSVRENFDLLIPYPGSGRGG